jgi:hypothetical protein
VEAGKGVIRLEAPFIWNHMGLWAVVLSLLVMMVVLAWMALAAPKCRRCSVEMVLVGEEAHVSWWRTIVTRIYRCPSCGQTTQTTQLPSLYD